MILYNDTDDDDVDNVMTPFAYRIIYHTKIENIDDVIPRTITIDIYISYGVIFHKICLFMINSYVYIYIYVYICIHIYIYM